MKDKQKGKGLVCNIQRYSLHDGYGIRTNVFLKGCPLACDWCSNPETQNTNIELVYFKTKCVKCGVCVDCCPKQAIKMEAEGIVIDRDKCDDCGICVDRCMGGALQWNAKWMTVGEVMDEILMDVPFYRRSGGGVTFSGGSPTMQHDFLLQLLKECKGYGLHTAIETEGYFDWEKTKDIFEFLNLVLFDIKAVDPAKHKKFTGVDNAKILQNVQNINDFTDCELVVRVPVIPGYTYCDENRDAIGEVVAKLERVRSIDLLPFHQFGEAKYERLGWGYSLAGKPQMNADILKPWEEYFQKRGYQVHVGG